ncbi:hypothetical protein CsSME_00020368 [Camellia sinensis var. sinensis]
MEISGSDQIDQRGEKRLVEFIVESPEELIDKRQRLEVFSLDSAKLFVIQPRMKNASILSSRSAIKDLSVASVLSLLSDKAAFCAESDVVSITLAVQSAILAVGRIVENRRRHYDAVERLEMIEVQLKDERNKAAAAMANLKTTTDKVKTEARRAEEEQAKAFAEEEKARRAEERATSMDGGLKLAKTENVKLMAELEEAKKAQERVERM